MYIKTFSVGRNATKCYIVHNEEKEGIIIDPGAAGEEILNYLDRQQINVKYIINTHGHYDHIGANEYLINHTGAELAIHKEDSQFLTDPELNLSTKLGKKQEIESPSADIILDEKMKISIKDINFTILHTPGHTPGGICLYEKDEKVLFSGDTIFSMGVGRTDLPGSDNRKLMDAIENKLLVLPAETEVYPGHGEQTNINAFAHRIWPRLQ